MVGACGYVVNLACFGLAIHYLHVHHLVAAIGAFLVAIGNNFLWNRAWTFSGHPRRRAAQARFLAVSVAAFLISAAFLEILVSGFRLPAVIAQGLSIAAATPVGFIGNKMWTFKGTRLLTEQPR